MRKNKKNREKMKELIIRKEEKTMRETDEK